MTMLPDNHTTPPFATTPSTADTTPVPKEATPAPASDTTLTVTQTSHTAPTTTSPGTTTQPVKPQDRQGWIRFFRPSVAFPVLARGVSVYTLWNRAPVIPDSFPLPPVETLRYGEKLGSWYAIHLIWKPTSDTAETPWIDTSETTQAFPVMLDYLDRLAAAQATSDQDATQQARSVFQLLHVRELKVQVPRFYRLRYHKSKKTLQQEVFYTRRAFVLALQEQFGLLVDGTQDESLASAFDHYDRDLHSRGWIIINLLRALLVGVSDKAARILVNLLQRRDIDSPGQGISLDHYDDVLGRLGLWNSTQEIGDTLDQLESMVINGNKAINGQVLLSLVLALMGVVLSIYSILQPKNWEVQLWVSLGLLFIASLFFWCYAHFGATVWFLLGVLAIAVTLLLDTKALWLGPLMYLLSLSLSPALVSPISRKLS